jgi:RNA polymerase sigma factor (TIGR02999 family)
MGLLLQDWKAGSEKAGERLLQILYPELLRLASARLRKFNYSASFSTRDLMHEAMVKILKKGPEDLADKSHLMALSAKAMRQVLLDKAKAKGSLKRKADRLTVVSTWEGVPGLGANLQTALDVEALNSALIRLHAIEPIRAQLVEMRFFGGMTLEEVSEAQDISVATVKRKWDATRAWLMEAIENDSRLREG